MSHFSVSSEPGKELTYRSYHKMKRYRDELKVLSESDKVEWVGENINRTRHNSMNIVRLEFDLTVRRAKQMKDEILAIELMLENFENSRK